MGAGLLIAAALLGPSALANPPIHHNATKGSAPDSDSTRGELSSAEHKLPKRPRENGGPMSQAQDPRHPAKRKLPRSSVEIIRSEGERLQVKVEIAADPASRSRGLMFEENLPAGTGMLFVFERDDIQSFWMKNTPLPLDMIFIAKNGQIVGIVENAQPFSETPRWVPKPSRYVLEVPGGWSGKKGVAAGDRVDLLRALQAISQGSQAPTAR